jgi:hypothetical protein
MKDPLGFKKSRKQSLYILRIVWNTYIQWTQLTESLGNVTVRGEKYGKSKRGARLSTVCLSMYSVIENIYCSQLSSVTILLQPEPNCFTSYNTRKWLCFLSPCTIVFRSLSASHVSSSNGQWSSQLFCVYCTSTLCGYMMFHETSKCVILSSHGSSTPPTLRPCGGCGPMRESQGLL